jgi:hypothetical protein
MLIEYYTQKLVQGSDSGRSRGVRYSRQETLGSINTDHYRLHKNIHTFSHGIFHQSIFLEETKRQFHLMECCYLVVLRLLRVRCNTVSSTLAGNTNRTRAVRSVISAMLDCLFGLVTYFTKDLCHSLTHSITHIKHVVNRETLQLPLWLVYLTWFLTFIRTISSQPFMLLLKRGRFVAKGTILDKFFINIPCIKPY